MLPALLVFSLGLSMTVAPLTATVLADADEHNAGIASGVNNAVARVAALLATAAVGAVVASQFAAALEERLAGRQLGPAGAAAVREAERRTLGDVAPAGAPGAERAAISAASLEASTEAFRPGDGRRRGARRRRWAARPGRDPGPPARAAVATSTPRTARVVSSPATPAVSSAVLGRRGAEPSAAAASAAPPAASRTDGGAMSR